MTEKEIDEKFESIGRVTKKNDGKLSVNENNEVV